MQTDDPRVSVKPTMDAEGEFTGAGAENSIESLLKQGMYFT